MGEFEGSMNELRARHDREIAEFQKKCEHRRVTVSTDNEPDYYGHEFVHIKCRDCGVELAHFENGKFTSVRGWKKEM